MATSQHTDQVEIPTFQGQQKTLSISEILGTFCRKFCDYLSYFNSELNLDFLSSSGNVSSPKNRVRTTTSSEQPLKVPTEIVNDNNRLQGTATVSLHDGPSDATTQHTSHHQPPQNPIITYLESIPSVIQATSERSLTPGTQFESSAVLISEHDLPHDLPHELVLPHGSVSIQEDTASLEITGEPHGILSSAAGTREQSSRKGLLEGNTWFLFCLSTRPSLCKLDIFLDCSLPHHFNDELTLAIMQSGNFETLCLMKISPTKWKAVKNIDL
jgi:hypothetical protein